MVEALSPMTESGPCTRPSWVDESGGGVMRGRISRRWFLQQMTLGCGVTALGGSLVWWVSAPAEPPQRKTASGELLETVAGGELPAFARTGGATGVGGF